jgi:hypothetical protein
MPIAPGSDNFGTPAPRPEEGQGGHYAWDAKTGTNVWMPDYGDLSKPTNRGRMTPGDLARSVQLEQVGTAEDLAKNGYSQNLADYTYQPTMEGAAPDLVGKMQYLGEAAPIQNVDQYRTDTTGVDAQKDVLARDKSLLDQGGLSAIDRARIAQSRDIRGAEARGNEGAIQAQAAQQGRAGGNASMIARLMSRQGQAQSRSSDDLQTQAQALQRQDTIRGELASVGGQVQTASDAIDNLNTQGRRDNIRAAWQQTQLNKGKDVSTHNLAAGTEWTENTDRENRNVGDTRAANQINTSPTGGQRGMDAARREAASGLLGGAVTGAANANIGLQANKDNNDAQAKSSFIQGLTDVGKVALPLVAGAL